VGHGITSAAWQDRLGHTRAQQAVGNFKMKRPGEGTNELAFAKTMIRLFIDAP
jgi:hypothetical protein